MHRTASACAGAGVTHAPPMSLGAQDYDPWSAGRPRITVDFISDLDAEAEDRRMVENALAKAGGREVAPDAEEGGAAPASSAAVKAATLFADHENLAKDDAKAATEAREAIQLRNIFSLARHGKYREVEELLNSPDWTLGVDAKDAQGNTLLMVAAQNNNKRIAKLALRRGAQINEQNVRLAPADAPTPSPCTTLLNKHAVRTLCAARRPNCAALLLRLRLRAARQLPHLQGRGRLHPQCRGPHVL